MDFFRVDNLWSITTDNLSRFVITILIVLVTYYICIAKKSWKRSTSSNPSSGEHQHATPTVSSTAVLQGEQSILASSCKGTRREEEEDLIQKNVFRGPNIPQVINYNVTTPPLSRKNIPVFTSPHSIHANSNIYQTLTLDLEHMYIEQKNRSDTTFSTDGSGGVGDGGGTCSVNGDGDATSVGVSLFPSSPTSDITASSVATYSLSNSYHQNYNTDVNENITRENNKTNHDEVILKHKKKKKNKRKNETSIIPISAITNISTQGSKNPATLIITIDTHIINSLKKKINHHDTTHENDTLNAGGANSCVSLPYYDFVNDQVTIDNWKTHGMDNKNGNRNPTFDNVTHESGANSNYYHDMNMKDDSSSMGEFDRSSHDHDDQQQHHSIHDEDNDMDVNDDDSDNDDDECSTITSGDMFSQYTVGKLPMDNENNNKAKHNNKHKSSNNNNSNHSKKAVKLLEREYTFASEREAASFQTLYLTLRVVGKEIRNMYSALESIHIDIVNDKVLKDKKNDDDCDEDEDGTVDNGGDDNNDNDQGENGDADETLNFDDENEEGKDQIDDENDKLLSNFLSPHHFGIQRLRNAGVHWNDVQRCLGELSFIASNHNIQYKRENNSSILSSQDSKCSSMVTSSAIEGEEMLEDTNHNNLSILQSTNHDDIQNMYKGKRMILGYLDFVNLFVPCSFPGTPYYSPTILEGDDVDNGVRVHQARIKQLLELRQSIAIASTRVYAYVNAMEVVEQGWNINENTPEPVQNSNSMLSKRMAFDEDSLNARHDDAASNEYYEPIGGLDARRTHDNSETFLHQAFSLVDCHIFEYHKESDHQNGSGNKLLPHKDPAVALPSLKAIMEKNPDKEFFIAAFFHEISCITTVMLFIRNISQGADTEFDDKLDSFVNYNGDFRNIELSIQLGPKPRMSYARLGAMQLKTVTSRLLGYDVIKNPYSIWQDTNRISFTSFNLSQHSKVRHFGGLPHIDEHTENSPKNYFAITCEIQSSVLDNYPARIFKDVNEQSANVVDFIFHFENCKRPLSILRMVHLDSTQAKSIPTDDSATSFEIYKERDEETDNVGEADVETLKEILSCITVPIRVQVDPVDIDGTVITFGSSRIACKDNICDTQVLSLIGDGDLKRHLIAAKSDLKEAAVRIVKCAAWRGVTFPIDTRLCQIELRSNQCFHQGFDREGNPILYFRNMCQGLWRKDVDATVLATLYRLESACQSLILSNPNFKFTLIILMGKPFNINQGNGNQTLSNEQSNDPNERANETKTESKIDPTSSFHPHGNFKLAQQLIGIVRKNYPERLAKSLIIPNSGWQKLLGTHGLERYVSSLRTAKKIFILNKMEDLLGYVDREELSILVGGTRTLPDMN